MAESVLKLLSARAEAAVRAAFGPEVEVPDPLVLPSRDPRHGDYTCTAAMALARTLRAAPLALAGRLAAALDVADVCEPPEVSAPGFVNLRLRPDWLADHLAGDLVERTAHPETVVLDYSAPNVAKHMHVGHLRSTVIGDCLGNVYEALGHGVERVNHVGDWGTQFGMLVAHLDERGPDGGDGDEEQDLEALYQEANARFKDDESFRERARGRVVDLQSGEATARAIWTGLVERSRREFDSVYELLGVHRLVERGESFYEPMLAEVVAELEAKGLVVVDDGAKCVFVPGFTNKDGDPLPLIVQKADGGYNYASTDLAALRHRVVEEGADRVLYVVDIGQSQHLQMVFAVARMAGWIPDGVVVRHVPFGLVLGEGGKRMRTRSGASVRLIDLLREAVARAALFITARAEERGEAPPDDVAEIARVIGVGAVKYYELSQYRTSNYEFSFDRMLSLKGNTAPYLQYAYARIRSILRDGGEGKGPLVLREPQEIELAKRLAALPDVLDRVVADDAPNHLCTYLFEVSQAYNSFYEHCPVLRSEEPVRTSRLYLCALTAESLRSGLALLGIDVVERI